MTEPASKTPRDSDRERPEGPYERGDGAAADQRTIRDEQVRFVDFVAQIYDGAETLLGPAGSQREMRMILHLIASHFDGQLVTSSSLAAASGLSYGTALRTIDDLDARGLVVRRERTASGRSHSLHPSAMLLARWRQFAYRSDALMRGTLGKETPAKPRRTAPSAVLPPPAVLETKLGLGRGLRVLVHADPTFMAMLNLKRQFEMIMGTRIESRAHSIDRLHAELIANAQRPVSQYDIVAVDLPWFGEMADAGRLLPLDALVAGSGFDQTDIYPDALASSFWQGQQYGVPIMVSGEILVYRKDLLAAAGLEPPRTVEQTLAVARSLHDPKAGIAGISWNGGRGTPLGHTFMMVMSAFGQPVIDLRPTSDGYDTKTLTPENLRPMFQSEAALQTVEYLLDLLAVSPPGILQMAWYDRARTYAKGRAAMAYSHSLLAPIHETDATSPAYQRTGYAPHPTGPKGRPIVPMGGYSLAIPANIAANRIGEVWRALQTLTTASATKLYLANGSLASSRTSVSRDPEVAALSPMISAVDEMARQGYLRIWPRPPVPGISDLIVIAGEEIHDILSGTKTARDALDTAQRRALSLPQFSHSP
ncbi:extracellular solute-binding protein [Paragemmobacter straminiformis]|uniref:Extracellular solute-binding protein n=1 Tax=Paragemmobacter straminiformis TaxID=2045119 RepID=A0A842I4N1_9RHOB|nr:extracellular solute-binding protein [Gemmobacter straminiformis]MBC2834606.1 extracellular solute-binding protein [Gemmobacter straminiformis]